MAETREIRTLKAIPATPEALAPFGYWIGADAPVETGRSAFYGDTVALKKPAKFVGDNTLDITVATIHRRPLQVSWLERHFLHTQTFIPLGGKPFMLVLCPPTEGDMPNLDDARAFLFDGTTGLTMHLGTWHEFPLALEDDTNVVVLIRKDTVRDLSRVEGNEAHGPDLDKKDIVARTGVTLQVDPA